MKEYTVDRIENGIAVCISDDDKVHKVPVASIPFAIGEGDILATRKARPAKTKKKRIFGVRRRRKSSTLYLNAANKRQTGSCTRACFYLPGNTDVYLTVAVRQASGPAADRRAGGYNMPADGRIKYVRRQAADKVSSAAS